jgi:hypothetical protein
MMHLPEAIQSIDVSIYTWLGGFAGNWVLDRLAGYEEGNPILGSEREFVDSLN